MTNTEVDKLEAGRELDALVAEKVMGWNVWRSKYGYFNVEHPDMPSQVSGHGTERYSPQTGKKLPAPKWWDDWAVDIPMWSTDISAAWEVVEKLDCLQFNLGRENCAGIRFDAAFYDDLDMKDKVHAMADTVPLAICRAALKAVQKE
tara:strand:- start:7047 stop:7487 length:441 start_codon:yes stop_codon:yes gene_type:complete